MTALTFEMARTLSQAGARATRWWSAGSTTTRTSGPGCWRPGRSARRCAGPSSTRQPASSTPEAVAAVVGDRTRLVAVTAASNLIGTMPDVPAIAAVAHGVGALLYVDAVHLAPHGLVDRVGAGRRLRRVLALQVLRPALRRSRGHAGAAGVAAPRQARCPRSDAVPERFELGTLPYELLAGVTAAVDVHRRHRARRGQSARAARRLDGGRGRARARAAANAWSPSWSALPGATLHSRSAHRTPTLLVTFEGHDPKAVSRHLAAMA